MVSEAGLDDHRAIVLAAVGSAGAAALQHAAPHLRADRKVIEAAIQSKTRGGREALQLATIQKDEALIEMVEQWEEAKAKEPGQPEKENKADQGDEGKGEDEEAGPASEWHARGRWCTGSSVFDVFVLIITLLGLSAFLVLQVTNFLDEIPGLTLKGTSVRLWCGITDSVQIGLYFILVPAILLALWILVQLTCCWRWTVRSAHDSIDHTLAVDTTWAMVAVRQCCDFYSGPFSPYFFMTLFLSEVNEFFWQMLAVDQMSRGGYGRAALSVYCGFLVINSFTPLIIRYVTARVNRVDFNDKKEMNHLASWMGRLLIIDALCDLRCVAHA